MNSERLAAIDYLKAIAIILVIITHSLSNEALIKYYGPFWINMAVPIFMIISGYTYSMSADRNDIKTAQQWFYWKSITPKLKRIMFPYIITMGIETIAFMLFAPELVRKLIKCYIVGGLGPGSYYFPMLVQLLFIFPLMFCIFKKSPIVAIILSFGVHLCFDIVSNTLPIADSLYRLLIFRYLAFIVLGILLYHYKKVVEKHYVIIALTSLSAIYIWMCNYYGYVPFMFKKWTVTSLPTSFWAFSLVILGFKYLEIKSANWIAMLFSTIGKASYHIFLMQMVYFSVADRFIKLNVELNIFVCLFAGILFYYSEIFVFSNNKFKLLLHYQPK